MIKHIKFLIFFSLIFSSLLSQSFEEIIEGDFFKHIWDQSEIYIEQVRKKNPNKMNGLISEKIPFGCSESDMSFYLTNGIVSGPFRFSWLDTCNPNNSFKLIFNVDYVNGLKNGTFSWRMSTYKEGFGWFENVSRVDGSFLNNLKNGRFTYWNGGGPFYIVNYTNDVLNGPVVFYRPIDNIVHYSDPKFTYPLVSDRPYWRGIFENGSLVSSETINKRGRIIERSGKSKDEQNKQLRELQKSLDFLGKFFGQ